MSVRINRMLDTAASLTILALGLAVAAATAVACG